MSVRVLVVDDDPVVLRTMARVLGRAGFDVVTAEDAHPALQLAAARCPDIALVDFNMPTSGVEVVRELKLRCGENVFVAVLTGLDDADMRACCLAAGADAVLIKPVAPSDLTRRLRAAAMALKMQLAAS